MSSNDEYVKLKYEGNPSANTAEAGAKIDNVTAAENIKQGNRVPRGTHGVYGRQQGPCKLPGEVGHGQWRDGSLRWFATSAFFACAGVEIPLTQLGA